MVEVVSIPKKEKKCSNHRCEAILSYSFSDIKRRSSTDYSGSTEYYDAIQCPICMEYTCV